MDLTYCKSQRRKTRADLRNYLALFRDDIIKDFDIELPERKIIQQMQADKFDDWFMSISKQLSNIAKTDLTLIELIDDFVCSVNNVATAEYEENLVIS